MEPDSKSSAKRPPATKSRCCCANIMPLSSEHQSEGRLSSMVRRSPTEPRSRRLHATPLESSNRAIGIVTMSHQFRTGVVGRMLLNRQFQNVALWRRRTKSGSIDDAPPENRGCKVGISRPSNHGIAIVTWKTRGNRFDVQVLWHRRISGRGECTPLRWWTADLKEIL